MHWLLAAMVMATTDGLELTNKVFPSNRANEATSNVQLPIYSLNFCKKLIAFVSGVKKKWTYEQRSTVCGSL